MILRPLLLSCIVCSLLSAQQTPTNKQVVNTAPEQTKKAATPNYLQEAAGSSIFIYPADKQPCEPPPGQEPLLPLGSGFVVGITNESATPPQGQWMGWKFLVTAGHVVHNQSAVIVRLNKADGSGFACFPITLSLSGNGQNVFSLENDPVDVAAIALPLMPGTDPTVFAYSYILDANSMASGEIKVGTNVFTVGYLFGYSGQKQNYPVTKFGKISLLTSEAWFQNPEWKRDEQAYLIELQNTPGLSGAPVMLYGPEFYFNPFRFRDLPPLVVGVVKGLLLAPVNGYAISQGVAAIEPGDHVRELMRNIADKIKAGGGNPGLK